MSDEFSMDVDEVVAPTSSQKVSLTTADIAGNVMYIVKGIELNQPRLLHRAIKQNVTIRRFVQSKQLLELLDRFFPADYDLMDVLKSFVAKLPVASSELATTESIADVNDAMDITSSADNATKSAPSTPGKPPSIAVPPQTQQQPQGVVLTVLPEVEVYLSTMILSTLMRYELFADAADLSALLVERMHRLYNRRSMDAFACKLYSYFSLSHEKVNQLANIRVMLLRAYRTACVRRDELSQAVLLNLLLRNYLHYNLVDAAYTLSMRSTFPENASNNQFCRFLYYMGRIQAIQLDYNDAFQRLTMASRKAPQGYALSFVRSVQKLIVLVQLLNGEIPERSVFNSPELRESLKPYLALTQAVRQGDVQQFNEAVQRYAEAFQMDKNALLVQRLGHNVLKIGLRKISLSYSRVSLADIAMKLHLPSAEAAEYICAKAIFDGVIDAKIDHERSWLSSSEVVDLYSTEEPQRAFHKRIAFCLDVHNEAVKSMRYPPDLSLLNKKEQDQNKKDDDLDNKSIEELIKELEDDYDE